MSKPGLWSFLPMALVGYLVMPACSLPPLVCTLAGGQDGLILEVQVTGGTLPPGDYAIIARVEGVEARLEETLASGGSTRINGNTDAVVDGNHLFVEGVVSDQHGFLQVGFRERGGPTEVAIEVQRDAAMIGQKTYTPKYTEYLPNGEGCPPKLMQAHDNLMLTAPSP